MSLNVPTLAQNYWYINLMNYQQEFTGVLYFGTPCSSHYSSIIKRLMYIAKEVAVLQLFFWQWDISKSVDRF